MVRAASRLDVPVPWARVATTELVAVEMTETSPVKPLPTQTCEPSGLTVTDIGSRPTETFALAFMVAAESTETESEFMSAT